MAYPRRGRARVVTQRPRRPYVPSKGASLVLLGQATETDIANAVTPARVKALTQATETDTANATRAGKGRTLTQPSETDSATAFSHYKTVRLTQATETDTAGVVGPHKVHIIPFGQATSELDTTTAFTVHGGRNNRPVTLVLTTENGDGLVLTPNSTATLHLFHE